MPESALLRYPCHLVSTSYQALSHFHGDNTGSNPVGDANKIKSLEKIEPKPEGLKGFDNEKPNSLILFLLLLLL